MPTKGDSPDAELLQTHDALGILLSDDSAFESVLNAIFEEIDVNCDGKLDCTELERYIHKTCTGMGVLPPQQAQVQGAFKQLDLNHDQAVNREELGVFLRHFFQEQVKYCALKLRLPRRA